MKYLIGHFACGDLGSLRIYGKVPGGYFVLRCLADPNRYYRLSSNELDTNYFILNSRGLVI